MKAMGMIRCAPLLLLLVWPALLDGAPQNGTCLVDQIQVKADFNVTRYLGRWYEMRWLAAYNIPHSELFQDYYHNYVATDTSNVTGMVRGRYPNEPNRCFSTNITLAMTANPGKMTRILTNATDPYWVIDTDYTSYALVYGCNNVSSSNTCNGASLWLWSRTTTMSNERLNALKNIAETQLCLNLTFLLSTTHSNPCPLDPTGSAAFSGASLLVLTASLVASLLSP